MTDAFRVSIADDNVARAYEDLDDALGALLGRTGSRFRGDVSAEDVLRLLAAAGDLGDAPDRVAHTHRLAQLVLSALRPDTQ